MRLLSILALLVACQSAVAPEALDAAAAAGAADAGEAAEAAGVPDVQADPHDLEIELGQRADDATFVPLVEGQDVEIETAGQPGGVFHVEIDLRIAPPPGYDATTMKLWVEGTTTEPADGPEVGHYMNKKTLAYHQPPEAPEFRPQLPAYIIFDGNKPDPYAGKECRVTLRVGLYLPGEKLPTLWTVLRRTFHCVNEV